MSDCTLPDGWTLTRANGKWVASLELVTMTVPDTGDDVGDLSELAKAVWIVDKTAKAVRLQRCDAKQTATVDGRKR